MPLDHYIPQVHLKRFYSPELGGEKMFGVRKRDSLVFPCASRDVCRIEDGSTNAYLLHDRAIEDFLKTIEPKYNSAVENLRMGDFSADDIYVIAGFAAYVTSCSPTALRLGSDPLKHVVESTTVLLDEMGELPPAPDIFGGRSFAQLIQDRAVVAKIDPKYPHALGISQILERTGLWGNARWDLLYNDHTESPFFTSDFASAIEQGDDNRVLNRLIPLTPEFAVRIRPSYEAKPVRGNLDFPLFGFKKVRLRLDDIVYINRAIVRSAEELVFSTSNRAWVSKFVAKNSGFWIEPLTDFIPTPKGTMHVFRARIGLRPS